jgi:hypothetical protein
MLVASIKTNGKPSYSAAEDPQWQDRFAHPIRSAKSAVTIAQLPREFQKYKWPFQTN